MVISGTLVDVCHIGAIIQRWDLTIFFGEGQNLKKKSYSSLRWLLNTVQCIKILKQTHQTPINNLYHFEEFIVVTLQKR